MECELEKGIEGPEGIKCKRLKVQEVDIRNIFVNNGASEVMRDGCVDR